MLLRLQLLIGADPIVRVAQQKNPKYKNAHSLSDYIRCDLQHLEVKEQYVEVVRLLKVLYPRTQIQMSFFQVQEHTL